MHGYVQAKLANEIYPTHFSDVPHRNHPFQEGNMPEGYLLFLNLHHQPLFSFCHKSVSSSTVAMFSVLKAVVEFITLCISTWVIFQNSLTVKTMLYVGTILDVRTMLYVRTIYNY